MENSKKIENYLENKRCLIILGPTGIGKTKISLELAKKLNSEIINTDAFSFYKNVEIMTAKASKEEKKIVKHHLIDFLEIDDVDFSVSNFQKFFDESINQIYDANKIPIIVGGSNYYIDYVLFDKRINIVNVNNYDRKEDLKHIDQKLSLFVDREKLKDLITALKNHITIKFSIDNLEKSCTNIDLINKGQEKFSEKFLSKIKKPKKLYNKEIKDLTINILENIENSYIQILNTYSNRFLNNDYFTKSEITKTENLLFDALNDILDYKCSYFQNISEKEYSYLLYNLIEYIDIKFFNILHKYDLRKINNVIKYYLVYGKAKSLLLKRHLDSKKNDENIRFKNCIVVYIKSLNYENFQNRVKARIDQMLNEQKGLEEIFITFEYFDLINYLRNINKNDNDIKNQFDKQINFQFQRGLLQAIGFKEFFEFYILINNLFLEYLNVDNKFENSYTYKELNNYEFFELFEIDKIEINYLSNYLKLGDNNNNMTNKFFFQMHLILFVYYIKHKFLYQKENLEKFIEEDIIGKNITDYFNKLKINNNNILKNIKDIYQSCKDLLIKNTLKYAKSQIKFIENRITPCLNKEKFSKENHNFLKYEIIDFKEINYENIINDITENLKMKTNKDNQCNNDIIFENEKLLGYNNENIDNFDNIIITEKKKKEWKKYACDVCGLFELNGDNEYKSHMESNKHKKRKRKINKINQEKESLFNVSEKK